MIPLFTFILALLLLHTFSLYSFFFRFFLRFSFIGHLKKILPLIFSYLLYLLVFLIYETPAPLKKNALDMPLNTYEKVVIRKDTENNNDLGS